MMIRKGRGRTEYGPGVQIELTGAEIAIAVEAWLVAHDVTIRGPRTITVNGELVQVGSVYVDPQGFIVHDGKRYSGWESEP